MEYDEFQPRAITHYKNNSPITHSKQTVEYLHYLGTTSKIVRIFMHIISYLIEATCMIPCGNR